MISILCCSIQSFSSYSTDKFAEFLYKTLRIRHKLQLYRRVEERASFSSPAFINSSLNESLENLMVLRLYKIVIAFRVIPNEFRGWGSMRRTKCDQDQGNRTLRSGVRGQNEGKIGTFGCDIFLTRVYITLNISKTMNNEDLVHSSSFSRPLTQLYPSTLNFKLPSPEWWYTCK